MDDTANRRWILIRRPRGEIAEEDFSLETGAVEEPSEGEVVVRTEMFSCDPTQRGWIGGDSYLPAVPLRTPVRAFAAGRVVRSRHPDYRKGDRVSGILRWEEFVRTAPSGPYRLGKVAEDLPLGRALGLLGMNGATAYFGLLDIGRPRAGETVVVSGGAGATGSIVGQIAKIKGCRVVGIAGSGEKCRWLTEAAGFDAAIDYKSEDVAHRLGQLCPDGIDVFFDNVGGAILDAALEHLAMRGRVVLCGAISRYNAVTMPPGPRNYLSLLIKRGRMEGFIVLDHASRYPEAAAALAGWWKEGRLVDQVDVIEGFENLPRALRRLFTGENRGKQLVQV